MGIQMVGIDHSRAGIDVRSIFSFTKKGMEAAYEQLKQEDGIQGCVMISTCNRMELWVSTKEESRVSLTELLCRLKGVEQEPYRRYFVRREGREAAKHLFRLSGGLESRILGEDQIITQVKEALSFAREHYATDHVLEVLFRMAVTAGKKVKTEVVLSSAGQSVIHQALAALAARGYEVAGKRCMVIGNGAMGKLAASTLQQRGAEVTVTVRQYRSGMVDIPANCRRINYGERMELFGQCDLVVSATTSPNFTIRAREVKEAAVNHPVLLIDLAVPRDIEPEVAKLPYMTVYDIDSFQGDPRDAGVKAGIARAEEILEAQEREFFDWYEGRDLIPRIQRVKELAAKDVDVRLTRVLKGLPLDGEQEAALERQIDHAAVRMMNRLLFGLRAQVSERSFRECMEALENLYGAGENLEGKEAEG